MSSLIVTEGSNDLRGVTHPGASVPVPSRERAPKKKQASSPKADSLREQVATQLVAYVENCREQSVALMRTQRGPHDMFFYAFERAEGLGEPMTDMGDIGDLMPPFVGNNIIKANQAVRSTIFHPDGTLKVDVQPKFRGPVSREQLLHGRRAAMALKNVVEDGLTRMNFAEFVGRLQYHSACTGNAYVLWSYTPVPEAPTEAPELEVEEEVEDLGAEDIFPSGDYTSDSAVAYRYEETPQLLHPCNVFLSSLEVEEGAEALPWIVLYTTTTYSTMCAERVQRDPVTGTPSGRYANIDQFYGQEREVNRIYLERLENRSSFSFDNDFQWTIPRGLQKWVWIGRLSWNDALTIQRKGDVTGGAMSEADATRGINALLREYGNIPVRTKNALWWIVEVIDGNLVSIQPYPHFRAQQCPFTHMRDTIAAGKTLGRGKFDQVGHVEMITCFFLQSLVVSASEMANPAKLVNISWLEKKYRQQVLQDKTMTVVPGTFIPVDTSNPQVQMDRIIVPVGAGFNEVQAASNTYAEMKNLMDTMTSALPFSPGTESKPDTATQVREESNVAALGTQSEGLALKLRALDRLVMQYVSLIQQRHDDTVTVMVRGPQSVERFSFTDPSEKDAYTREMSDTNLLPDYLASTIPVADLQGEFSVSVTMFSQASERAEKIVGFVNAAAPLIPLAGPGVVNMDMVLLLLADAFGLGEDGIVNDPEMAMIEAQRQAMMPQPPGAQQQGSAPAPKGENPVQSLGG